MAVMKEFKIERLKFYDYTPLELLDFVSGITKGDLRLKDKSKRTENQRQRLWNRLLTESGGEISSTFEFLPTILEGKSVEDLFVKIGLENFENWFVRFSYRKDNVFYTNMRTILKIEQNFGVKIDYNINWQIDDRFKDFVIIYGYVPFKFITHITRHRRISPMVQTSRNKKYDPDIYEHESFVETGLEQEFKDSISKIFDIKRFFSLKNIRSEVVNMFLPQFRMVWFAISFWRCDPFTSENLFKVRGEKTGTFDFVGDIVKEIKNLTYLE